MSPRILETRDPNDRLRVALLGIAITVGAFVWFWFWRSNRWTGGDSGMWARHIDAGAWFRRRQMFTFALVQLTHRMASGLWGWSPNLTFNFVSCASGAAATAIVWRMFRGRPGGGWAAWTVATAGFTTVFYGHIETYATPAAVFILHLWLVQRVVSGQARPWVLTATFSLFMAFHLVAIPTLPAVALVAALEVRRSRRGASEYAYAALGLLPALVLWLLLYYRIWGSGELLKEHNFSVAPWEALRRPWLLVTQDELGEKAKFALWNAGAAVFLLPWIAARGWRDRVTLYLLAYLSCLIGFTLLCSPHAKEADFDLFCFPWIVACIVVARGLVSLPMRAVWTGALLGVNLALWLCRPAVWADVGARGYGEIQYETFPGTPETFASLDDSFPMRARNRFQWVGGHEVRILPIGGRPIHRIINLSAGETYRVFVGEDGVRIEKFEAPTR